MKTHQAALALASARTIDYTRGVSPEPSRARELFSHRSDAQEILLEQEACA